VLGLLHGPHRVGCRLVMILLSQQGLAASQIADLLGYDPSTVRRWIQRYYQHGTGGLADRHRSGRPRLGSARLAQRILTTLGQPKAWTIARLWHATGRPPISLRTLHRRVRQVANWRRPRLVAKGDPDRDQVLADLHQQLSQLPDGAAGLRQSRGMQQMSEYACRRNLPSDLGSTPPVWRWLVTWASDEWDESRL